MPDATLLREPFDEEIPKLQQEAFGPSAPVPATTILEKLPLELMTEILMYLPYMEDQINASLAYKPWYDIIVHSRALKRHRYAFSVGDGVNFHRFLNGSWLHTPLVCTVEGSRITKYKYKFRGLEDGEYSRFNATRKDVMDTWILDEPFFRLDLTPDADGNTATEGLPFGIAGTYHVQYTLMRHDGYKTATGVLWGQLPEPVTEATTVRQVVDGVVEGCAPKLWGLFPQYSGVRNVAIHIRLGYDRHNVDKVRKSFDVTAMAIEPSCWH
ncbi:hypothetical protein Dda_2017 [Drechslerella dactyloides]|uniref:F-box domain-containing protein n=1 Tax=Drechslerella dactyloides TaxID=74499 RepID=A0AAD6NNJ0_DREDA|nr:hypothetical protein Dda_2017 [Drechslerella dactyloides]